MLQFFVPGIPAPQPRPRVVPVALVRDPKSRLRCPGCSTPLAARTATHGTPRKHPAAQFRDAVGWGARAVLRGAQPLEGPLRLDLDLWWPRPKAKCWKTKPMPAEWKVTRPDATNVTKAAEDALDGLLWLDDAQVCDLRVRKRTVQGEGQPGAYVSVSEAGPLDEI